LTAAIFGGGGVTFGTIGASFGTTGVITLAANVGVTNVATPNKPMADSAVMRRNRPVILRSFPRSVAPERIEAEQPGSEMTPARRLWTPRVDKPGICIVRFSRRWEKPSGNKYPAARARRGGASATALANFDPEIAHPGPMKTANLLST
jgi:hypothetical protein